MNKMTKIVLPVILVLFGSSVYAQNTPSTNSSPGTQNVPKPHFRPAGAPMGMYPNLISKEKIEKVMQAFLEMGLLYKMLEQPTMVTTDGGFIVAYGNTLRKYDKDLNVIKEVDLDVNVDGMQDLAARFAKKYSAQIMDMMAPVASPSANAAQSASTSTVRTSSGNLQDDQKEEEIKKEIDQIK